MQLKRYMASSTFHLDDPLLLIRQSFAHYFSGELSLPVIIESNGTIEDASSGWTVKYLLAKDEQQRYYLDFVAHHRMTNTRHIRINAAGNTTALITYQECYTYNARWFWSRLWEKKKMQRHNQLVSKILAEKGLA